MIVLTEASCTGQLAVALLWLICGIAIGFVIGRFVGADR